MPPPRLRRSSPGGGRRTGISFRPLWGRTTSRREVRWGPAALVGLSPWEVGFQPIADIGATIQPYGMTYSAEVLCAAHRHSSAHRQTIEVSSICGCFYCLETFGPAEIERWLNEGSGTAICPHCQIDSVLGSGSGLPIEDPEFLRAMNNHWFGYLEASDGRSVRDL